MDLRRSSEQQPESLQANLIMPEPTPFLSGKFLICSITRRLRRFSREASARHPEKIL
jgi:hypothetical protein